MLIGSLIKLHAWLHLYLCFSFLKKCLSNLNTSLTPSYLLSFSTSFYHNLDSFSTAKWSIDKLSRPSIAGGSIELVFIFSIEFFLDRSSIAASVDVYYARHLLDTCLDTSRHLYLSRFTNFYIKVQHNPFLTFLDLSLDRLIFSPPKPLSLTPSLFLKVSSSFYKFFFTGKLRISHIHAFHVLKPRIWGFWKKKNGVFENCWVFVEILGWVVA